MRILPLIGVLSAALLAGCGMGEIGTAFGGGSDVVGGGSGATGGGSGAVGGGAGMMGGGSGALGGGSSAMGGGVGAVGGGSGAMGGGSGAMGGGSGAMGGGSGAMGGGSGAMGGGSGAMGGGSALALGMLSASVVSDAVAASLSSYHRNASTGDIWCLPCDGAPVVLALAAFQGNTSVDMRLLQQIRQLLSGSNDPFATGGYAANDERNATAMYAIARRVPRIWNQLTSAEVHKVDLIMEATLVADLWATSDKNNMNGAPRTFDGSNDSNRDYNPNYREGMIGAVIVGTEYFGGKTAVDSLVASYDHAAFTSELQAQGLANAYWTYSTYMRTPSAGAPSPSTVQTGIQGYTLYGMTIDALQNIYLNLVSDTFSANVSCGLNNGAGIQVGSVYAGRIVSGCSGLPNMGAVGMEKEFDSVDGNGARSDASYVRLGLRDNLFNELVLIVYGDWQVTTAATAAVHKVNVGVTDFFYKATQGYQSYSHGTNEGLFNCSSDMDCPLNQALWTQVLAPAHGL
jgi:hypothetical protein